MAREGTVGKYPRKGRQPIFEEGRWRCISPAFFTPFPTAHVTHRMGIALASLISGIVALYLHLWKLGLTGSLACSGSNGCAYVQGSPYGWFLGVDVALIGTIGYAALFSAALLGTLPAFEDATWPNTLMAALIWPAVLFTLRLKYGEFVVLKGFCPWCLVSAIAITVCAVLITLDRRRLARLRAGPATAHGVS